MTFPVTLSKIPFVEEAIMAFDDVDVVGCIKNLLFFKKKLTLASFRNAHEAEVIAIQKL